MLRKPTDAREEGGGGAGSVTAPPGCPPLSPGGANQRSVQLLGFMYYGKITIFLDIANNFCNIHVICIEENSNIYISIVKNFCFDFGYCRKPATH